MFLNAGLFANDSHPVAERIGRQGLSVPRGMALTEDRMDRVVDAVKNEVRG